MRIFSLLLLLTIVIPGNTSLQAQNMVTAYPQEYPDALSNPLMGFRPSNGDWNIFQYPILVHDYIRWNEIENVESDSVDKIRKWSNAMGVHASASSNEGRLLTFWGC